MSLLQGTVLPQLADGTYPATIKSITETTNEKGGFITVTLGLHDAHNREMKWVVFPTNVNYFFSGVARELGLDVSNGMSYGAIAEQAVGSVVNIATSWNETYNNRNFGFPSAVASIDEQVKEISSLF